MGLAVQIALFVSLLTNPAIMGGRPRHIENDKNLRKPQAAQQPDDEVIRVTTRLVNVPVSVKGSRGEYVADLRRDEFLVFEDQVKQDVAHFDSTEVPLSVVLLFDSSWSVVPYLASAKQAAISLVEQLRASDSALLLAFNERDILAPLTASTRERALLRELILGLRPNPEYGPGTKSNRASRVYDGVDFVIRHVLKNGTGRKAVILLSDGEDLNSRVGTYDRSLRAAAELGVPFYSIHTGGSHTGFTHKTSDPADLGRRASARILRDQGITYMKALAGSTGGTYYELVPEITPQLREKSAAKVFNLIAEELRHQYVLGYYPNAVARAGRRRKIKVEVSRPKVKVRSREWYLLEQPPEK